MKIQPKGLYHFITEMPGNEAINEWGPDPEPHIHYDIECTGCAAGHGVVDGDYKYWNKFYPEDLCTIDGCGTQVGFLFFFFCYCQRCSVAHCFPKTSTLFKPLKNI